MTTINNKSLKKVSSRITMGIKRAQSTKLKQIMMKMVTRRKNWWTCLLHQTSRKLKMNRLMKRNVTRMWLKRARVWKWKREANRRNLLNLLLKKSYHWTKISGKQSRLLSLIWRRMMGRSETKIKTRLKLLMSDKIQRASKM